MTLAEFRAASVINLTPHEITLRYEEEHNATGVSDIAIAEGGFKQLVFPPSGEMPARVGVTYHEISEICAFVEYGEVYDLPEPVAGTVYLVSAMVLSRLSESAALQYASPHDIATGAQYRQDVFAPDTANHAIRDDAGRIIAVTRLLCCPRSEAAATDQQQPKDFEYEFDATERTYGTAVKPYVARLELDAGKLTRDFLDEHLDRSWGKRELTVSGTYQARVGQIVECQFGGTAKNPDRMWYLIAENGEQHSLGNGKTDSRLQTRVKRYLGGKITAQDLLDTK